MAERRAKVMAVTGSRADWGYLSVPLDLMRADPAFDPAVVVTGQHLDAASGGTAGVIEAEGFAAAARVDMGLSGDSAQAVTHAMGRAVAGFGDVLAELRPDLMLILGDRYEILAAASAALLARIPVAHLAGGDVTEGAVDDAIRHALTKLSHLHFPTNEDAARRILRMGEDPARVHCVGSTGLDRLLKVPLMTRSAFFDAVGLAPHTRNLLVTMHPVTLAADPLADAVALLAALARLGEDCGLILTGANADVGGRELNERMTGFAAVHANAVFHPSLGTARYVNALAHCDAVVGNSSSGLYEAPSLKTPAVNIGSRQDGRLRAASVLDCAGEPEAIVSAISRALALDCSGIVNPYGDGHAAERIIAILKQTGEPQALLHKTFHMPAGGGAI